MSVCTACGSFYDIRKTGGLHCSLEKAPIRPGGTQMADRAVLQAKFVADAREGIAPGAHYKPNLLGEGRDVIFLKEQAYEVFFDEPPLKEGCVNIAPVQVVHRPLEEADDIAHPGLAGFDENDVRVPDEA